MKCANCAAEIKDGSIYCSVCGKEAQMIEGYTSLEEDFLHSMLFEEINPFLNKQTNGLSLEAQMKLQKRKRKTYLILTSLLFAVVLAIAASIHFMIDFKNNNSYEYQLQKAEQEFEKQQYENAIAHYAKALIIVPNDIETRLKMAHIYSMRKEYDSAIVLLTEVIRLDNDRIEAYASLIDIYEEKGQYCEIQKLVKQSQNEKVKEQFADYVVSAPIIYPYGDIFYDLLDITIVSVGEDRIYYTTDGSDPITNGKRYLEETNIHFKTSGLYTIRAVCKNEHDVYSDVIKQEFQVILMPAKEPETESELPVEEMAQ